MKPNCFNSDAEYQEWREAASVSNQTDRLALNSHGHCLDCLPEYHAEMIRSCRCEYPTTRFRFVDGGFIGWRDIELRRAA